MLLLLLLRCTALHCHAILVQKQFEAWARSKMIAHICLVRREGRECVSTKLLLAVEHSVSASEPYLGPCQCAVSGSSCHRLVRDSPQHWRPPGLPGILRRACPVAPHPRSGRSPPR